MNIDLLAKVGVDQTNLLSLDSLEKMQKFYETLNKSLVSQKESAKTDDSNPIRDAFRKTVTEDETLAESAKNVMEQVRGILSDAMQETPLVSIVLADLVKNLSSEVSAEKNYQEAVSLKDADIPVPTVDLPEDWADRRDEAAEVADLIRKVFGIVQKDVEKAIDDKTTKFKVKTSKDGILPALTKLVRDVKEDQETVLVGRAAQNSKVRYIWNGDLLPTSMLNEVLHDYVSNFRSGYVVSWGDLRDKVKAVGFDSYAEAAEVGTDLEFKTGTLRLTIGE